jgi:hypothetical protein
LDLDRLKQVKDVVKDTAATTVFNAVVDEFGTTMHEKVTPALDNFADKLMGAMDGLSEHPKAIAGVTLALVGVAGALSIMGSVFKGVSAVRGMAGLMGMGGSAAGAAGGMGAMGAMALPVAGMAAGGLAAYGGMNTIKGAQGQSFFGGGAGENGFFGSRASGYGAAIAGGAGTGALLGSFLGPVGTLVGAGLGGVAGGVGAWLSDSPSDASQGPANARSLPGTTQSNPASTASDASGQRGRKATSADQMTQRIMESGDRSANLLKMLKDNSDQHLVLVREEIAVMRGVGDRLSKLLEEGNRGTRELINQGG